MAEDLAPIPTTTIDPPTKNPKVEGLRAYYKSIGADGDSFAKTAYETYQSDSAQAEKVLDSHLRNAYKEKSSTGLGDISAFPSVGAPAQKKVKASSVSAPVEKPVLSASDNAYQASKPTDTGKEGGAIETFLRTALGNIAPNLTSAAVKSGSTVAQQILKGVEMISAINPDGLDSPMSTWARNRAKELQKADEDFLVNSPYTQKQLPSKGQDKGLFQDGKVSLSGTAGMFGDAISQIPSMLLSAVATRGASVPAQVASMWAVGTLQAAPSMYAESRKNGLSPEASDLVGYTASAVASAVDVLTGGESKLIGLSPEILRTASTKILGKSLGKASAVIDFINGTSVSQALRKVGINKFELGQLDAPTLSLFQTEMQNTKMGLMKKFGSYSGSTVGESIGEGISATAEKGTQWMYDKLLSEDGSSAGKGKFGVEWNDRHTWEDIGNEAAAGFGTGIAMNVGEFRGPNTAQTIYGAMEASTRLNGDATPVVAELTNEISTRLKEGKMNEEQAYSSVQRITRMGQVATTLAGRPDLSAQNKFDLFNISDRHLNPTDGSQMQKAQRVEQASQIISAIDTAMENPSIAVEDAAVLSKQRSDTLSALGVNSIEDARKMLARREKFLQGAKDSIIAGKPNYGNLNNGLKVAETFREGDIIRGLVSDQTTNTKRNEVATISSLSDDGQIATTEKGEQINLQLAQKADNDTISNYLQQKQAEEVGAMPENTNLPDSSWRGRVKNSVEKNGNTTTLNRVPATEFDESGNFVDASIPAKQEAALKGKTILLDYPTGEETAKFLGYNEDGNVMLSTSKGEYSVSPATLFSEGDITTQDEGGLFRGVIEDNDVDTVNEQLNAENFTAKPKAVTTTKPAKKATEAPIPLTETEREALAEVQAQTSALSDAMHQMASDEEGAIIDGLERVLSEIKPGDANSYLRAAKKVLTLGELFDESTDLKTHTMAQLLVNEANAIQQELDPEAIPFTVKGLSKIEIKEPNGKEQNRGGVAEGESQNGGNQAEGSVVNGENGQPTGTDTSQGQEPQTSGQSAENLQTGQSGNQPDSLQPASDNSESNPNTKDPVISASTPLDSLSPMMDELGMLSKGVTALLSAIHSFPSSLPVTMNSSTAFYKAAGGTDGSVVTRTESGFVVDMSKLENLSAKGLSQVKAWMTGGSISQNETHPIIGELATEAITGAYTSKKFAESIEGIENPIEVVQAVLLGASNGTVPLHSNTGRPTGLLSKLMSGSNVVERGDKGIYLALLDGWRGVTNSFASVAKSAISKAPLSKEKLNDTITLWHGSPHSFGEFKLEKIGTGEGQQKFGWGLYFTNTKSIAESYATTLSSKKGFWEYLKSGQTLSLSQSDYDFISKEMDSLGFDGTQADEAGATEISVDGKIVEDASAIEALAELFAKNGEKNLTDNFDVTPEELSKFMDIRNRIAPRITYEVSVNKNGSDYNWVQWDKPVSSGVSSLVKADYPNVNTETGKSLYNALSKELGSDKEASSYLSEKGVDGIEYPSNSLSGKTKEGQFNYVVFNENSVKVNQSAQFLKVKPIPSTTQSRTMAGRAVAILKAKFPALNVAYVSSSDFFSRFGQNAVSARTGNTITLNEAALSGEGVVHELGHIWGDVAEKYFPALHSKMVDALRGTSYDAIVSEYYPELSSDSARNSEMLAQAIGVRGERFLTGSKLDAFKDAFDRLMVRIADKLGLTGQNITQMKANALVDEVAKSILSEEDNTYISEMAEYMNGSLESDSEPQFLKIARPEIASQRTLEKAIGNINPVGINRNPYNGDVPDDISFSDIGLSKFDTAQQKKLLGMYHYPDGSVSKEKTKTISGKDVKGKKVSEDNYLKELITTEKDAILDANGMPSRLADDMPHQFDGLDDLSRYAFSDEQRNNYLHNYYPNGDLSAFVFIPKDAFKADNDVAATKIKDSYVLQSIAGETALKDIAQGLTNVTNMTKLLGVEGGVVRETMEGIRPAVLAMSNELGQQNGKQLDDLLEKYSSWSTFRQTGSEDTAQSIDLGNMLTGPFSVSGKNATGHKLTKAQAASLAFTLKSLFDDGHIATHITLPKGERSKDNQVYNMILDEAQSAELMNNLLAEPGMQDLYDSVDAHNKIVAEYLDKVHYMTEGTPMPKTKGFYWALKAGENYFNRDGLAEGSPRQILNASIIQDRRFNKDTFYQVNDAFEHLQNNFRLAERYVQLAPYSHVMENALHNITESADNNGLSVVRKNLLDYVKWATNLKSQQPVINFGGKFNIGWVFKNKARFALNGNPFVVLKQIPTFFALALDGTVSPGDVMNLKTTGKYAKLLAGSYGNTLMGMGEDNGSTIFGHTFEATDEEDIRRIASNPYQLETYQRLLGTVTPDVDAVMALRSSGASKIQNLSLVKNTARKWQDEHLSAPMKRADVGTVIIADLAARSKVERDMPGASQEDKNKMIGKLSNQLVRNTHATYDILDRPHYATSEDSISRAFMLFQSQTTKAYNRWLSAHIENEQAPSPRTRVDLIRQSLFLTTITPAVMVGTNIFRKLIMGAVLGDDKWEKFMENPWGNAAWEYARNLFGSVPGIPSAAGQFILSLVDNENWTDDLFDVNVLSPVADFVASGVNTAKGIGEDKYTKKSQADKAMFDGIKKVMRASAQLNGIPSIAEQIVEKRVVQPLVAGEEKAKRPTRPKRQRTKYSYLDMQMGDAPDRVINR